MTPDFLQETQKRLDLPPAVKAEVMRELESHLADIRAELLASGETDVDAQAQERLGSPEDVAARLNAAHNGASWKSALLAAAPFIAVTLTALLQRVNWIWFWGALLILWLITSSGSLREIIRGRRPVWLATWLAASIILLKGLISYAPYRYVQADAVQWTIFGGFITCISLAAVLPTRRWRPILLGLTLVYALSAVFAIWQAIVSLHMPPTLDVGSIPVGYVKDSVFSLNPGLFKPGVVSLDLHFLPGLCLHLATWGLLLLLARVVFELHPYGNGIRASVFLASLIVIGYGIHADSLDWLNQQFITILAAVLILVAVRTPAGWVKQRCIKTLLLAQSVVFAMNLEMVIDWFDPTRLETSGWTILVIFWMLCWTGIAQFYVMWPVRREWTRRAQIEPPQVVQ